MKHYHASDTSGSEEFALFHCCWVHFVEIIELFVLIFLGTEVSLFIFFLWLTLNPFYLLDFLKLCLLGYIWISMYGLPKPKNYIHNKIIQFVLWGPKPLEHFELKGLLKYKIYLAWRKEKHWISSVLLLTT